MMGSSLTISYTVKDNSKRLRLCDFIPGIFVGLETKSAVKKAIKKGQIFVNSHVASTANIVVQGDEIVWLKPVVENKRIFSINLKVIYEDDYLAVIFKPAGIVVNGNLFRCIENALPAVLKSSSQADALPFPLAVHRLDGLTSGLLITAKTYGVHRALGAQLQNKTISKEYTAVVMGKPNLNGEWNWDIDNKKSQTYYKVVQTWPSLRSKHLSLIKLYPTTGRTHQLRIHCSKAGFPILGDTLYGKPGHILKHKGMFLCATGLIFNHPFTNQVLNLSVDPPRKFINFPTAEQRRFVKYQ